VSLLRILTDRGIVILWQPESHRVCVISRSGKTRAHADHDEESADQGDSRALASDDSERVLRQRIRRELYHSLDPLQADDDVWIRSYNADALHRANPAMARRSYKLSSRARHWRTINSWIRCSRGLSR